jgi:hypothetical protein
MFECVRGYMCVLALGLDMVVALAIAFHATLVPCMNWHPLAS